MRIFNNSAATHGILGVLGLAFGATLAMTGFGDFEELNAMFTLRNLRMLFAFAGAVAVAAGLFALARYKKPTDQIHKGVVPGAVMFGAGWAISGGCPSIPLVQLGVGYLPAVASIAGIAVGMKVYNHLNAKYWHFDAGACSL